MNILLIGAADFVRERGNRGNSKDLDLLAHLHETLGNSFLTYTDTWHEECYEPNIVYIYDCDRPREHFTKIIKYYKDKKIPVILIADDVFHFDLVTKDHNTILCDGILFTVKMERLEKEYKEKFPDKIIGSLNNLHIDTRNFRDYDLPKKYDITIYGTYNLDVKAPLCGVDKEYFSGMESIPETYAFYPLRKRLVNLLLQNTDKFSINHIQTPQRQCWNCPTRSEELSKQINQSYLTIATRSRVDKCMAKYLEIAASDSMVLGNIPTDYKDIFDGNIVEVNDTMTDEQILDIISTALSDKENLLEKSRNFGKKFRHMYGYSNTSIIDEFIRFSNNLNSLFFSKYYLENMDDEEVKMLF